MAEPGLTAVSAEANLNQTAIHLMNESMASQFLVCSNESQIMADGRNQALPNMVTRKLVSLENSYGDPFARENGSGITSTGTTCQKRTSGTI
jgi:hypothetical protein